MSAARRFPAVAPGARWRSTSTRVVAQYLCRGVDVVALHRVMARQWCVPATTRPASARSVRSAAAALSALLRRGVARQMLAQGRGCGFFCGQA